VLADTCCSCLQLASRALLFLDRCTQIGGSGVLVQPMTYIFDEEPLRWQRLLENLGELLLTTAVAAGIMQACSSARCRVCWPCPDTAAASLCCCCGPAGIQDVESKEPEAVAAYMASNGAAAAPAAEAAGARR
jgi:hypothetical protein